MFRVVSTATHYTEVQNFILQVIHFKTFLATKTYE